MSIIANMLEPVTTCRAPLIFFGVCFFCSLMAGMSAVSTLEEKREPSYTTECIDSNTAFEALRGTHRHPNLCAETFQYHVLNESSGLVSFSLYLPYDSDHNEISLKTLKYSGRNNKTEKIENCSSEVDGIHSRFRLAPRNVSCSSQQMQEIKWRFSYLFTGCYAVEVDLLSFNCSSSSFFVESTFEKELIADKTPSLTYKLVGQSLSASFNFGMHFRHNFPQTVLAKISANNTHNGKRLACCSTSFGYFCNGQAADHALDSLCNCSWDRDYLECTFFYIPSGHYYLEMEVHDIRCEARTIWTKDVMRQLDPCFWEYSDLFVKNNSNHRVLPAFVSSSSGPQWGVSVLLVCATVAVLIIFWYCRCRRRDELSSSSPCALEALKPILVDTLQPSFTNKSQRILLLYARDCQPFMDAMIQLKLLIRAATGSEVLDIWDSDKYDEIMTQDLLWSSGLISSNEVQVVVVASPASIKIETLILKRGRVNYKIPDCRDDIFVSAFKSAVDNLATDRDRCRRFVVIRLSSQECSQLVLNSFSSLCTIYTLPQHTISLMKHVNGSPSNSTIFKKTSAALKNLVNEYDGYIAVNPDYIPDLFEC